MSHPVFSGLLAAGEERTIPIVPPLTADHRLTCVPHQDDVVVTSTLTHVTIRNLGRLPRTFVVTVIPAEAVRAVLEAGQLVGEARTVVRRALDFLRRSLP